jgi:hypothetical protein
MSVMSTDPKQWNIGPEADRILAGIASNNSKKN